ncbi:FadR/GntR family transcriptional regulator [Pseudomonas sp. PSKL.D1]|uniref:FadR/GntR family transcriptional regulator n=1 Tax=Pseudomonas sp. PSKL.D1 TaxID=3029060 RepID=UPI0023816348|nr:GntR family transcriptional regulator [Pseudomonas sp. PSKL.D1]WDY56213.1 GntR family transcriptional regulator [Pseudomonas sp. PSKL.D1]
MEPTAPPKRLSLAQQLMLELSRQILAGELPAGSKLPTEQALTEAHGVSRTVVREAMSKLQAEGLVETRRGIGTFVLDTPPPVDTEASPPHNDEAFDSVAIIELRLSLEVEAAAIAAQRATPEQLRAIGAALEQAHALGPLHADAAAAEFAFHLQIAHCTGNSFFIDAMTHLGKTLARMPGAEVDEHQRAQQVREREQIHSALVHREPEAARAAMRLHLTNKLTHCRQG